MPASAGSDEEGTMSTQTIEERRVDEAAEENASSDKERIPFFARRVQGLRIRTGLKAGCLSNSQGN
jgi:hypothetical protein